MCLEHLVGKRITTIAPYDQRKIRYKVGSFDTANSLGVVTPGVPWWISAPIKGVRYSLTKVNTATPVGPGDTSDAFDTLNIGFHVFLRKTEADHFCAGNEVLMTVHVSSFVARGGYGFGSYKKNHVGRIEAHCEVWKKMTVLRVELRQDNGKLKLFWEHPKLTEISGLKPQLKKKANRVSK